MKKLTFETPEMEVLVFADIIRTSDVLSEYTNSDIGPWVPAPGQNKPGQK